MSKEQKVLSYLQKHKKITSWQAILYFKATRLSAIIYRLRKEYDIDTIKKEAVSDEGNIYYYAEYIYKGKKDLLKFNDLQ